MADPFYEANKRLTNRQLSEFPLGGTDRAEAQKFGAVVEETDGTFTFIASNQSIRGLVLQDLKCFRDAMIEIVTT